MDHRQIILSRALYVRDHGLRTGHDHIVRAAENVIRFIESPEFDMYDLLRMQDYATVLRVWHKN